MCSRKNCTIDSPIVHQYALAQLGKFLELSNSGYKCKKDVVLNVLLLAATAMTSLYAICKKLALTPTGHAIVDALKKSFPDIDALELQINQAKIATCTCDPMLRLLYFGVELIMLNVWIWLHATFFTEKDGRDFIVHLEKLRFKEMLQWVEQVAEQLLHDGNPYTVNTS